MSSKRRRSNKRKREFPIWEDVICLLEELVGVEITFRKDRREFSGRGMQGGPIVDEGVQAIVGSIDKMSATCPGCNGFFLVANLVLCVDGTPTSAVIEQHYCVPSCPDRDDWWCGTEETSYKPGWLRMWMRGAYHVSKQMLLPYICRKKMEIYFYLCMFVHSDCTLVILDYIQNSI